MMAAVSLIGCAGESTVETEYDVTDEDNKSMFTEIEKSKDWRIVYDKNTRVMYAVSDGAYDCGNFTMLVDKDGKPKLWEAE